MTLNILLLAIVAALSVNLVVTWLLLRRVTKVDKKLHYEQTINISTNDLSDEVLLNTDDVLLRLKSFGRRV